MYHPCVSCHLRFATTGELTDHVRQEHLEVSEEPEHRDGVPSLGPRFDWSAQRTAFFPRPATRQP